MMYEYYTSKIKEMAYFLGFLANFPSFIFFLLYIDKIFNMKIISSDRWAGRPTAPWDPSLRLCRHWRHHYTHKNVIKEKNITFKKWKIFNFWKCVTIWKQQQEQTFSIESMNWMVHRQISKNKANFLHFSTALSMI